MATLMLLGAGASYGSDRSDTPPLGEGLFGELRRFNPDGWGTLQGDIEARFRTDFEDGMRHLEPQALAPLQRAMAAYFFKFQPRRSSLYFELAQRMLRANWIGALCTLNYERLLELSMLGAGLQPYIGNIPAGRSGVELCLPHGCSHIFCDAARGMASSVVFNGFAVQTDGPVTVISDPRAHRARVLQDAFPPVMSYFEPAKRTTAGRSFIEGQRARWRDLAANAETIVVVGVRVRPHDDHIWAPIAATNARVVYCGGPAGAPEYSTWAAETRANRGDVVLPGYFREEFGRICREAGV